MSILSPRKATPLEPTPAASAPAPDPAQLLRQQIEEQRVRVEQLKAELKAAENLLTELRNRQGTCYVIHHWSLGYWGTDGKSAAFFRDFLDPRVWTAPTPWAALQAINNTWKGATLTPEIQCIKAGKLDESFRQEYEGLMGRGRWRFFDRDGEIK